MAIAQFSVRIGSKGKATAHASYILREDKYKPHDEKLEKLEGKNHGNMPEWAKNDPKLFWKMSDEHERKNGSTYREHIIALPRELDEQQRLELVQEWIKQEIGDKHPYSYAIHTPKALDGQDQPHCHLMFSERTLDGIDRGADQFFKRYNSKDPSKGGAKKANKSATYAERKTELKEMRSRWGDIANKHLERAGRHERIDMRNYKDRGISEQDKPKNITMSEMNKPEIKQAHKEKLLLKQERNQTVKELMKEIKLFSRFLDNLEKRIAEHDQQKPQERPQTPPQGANTGASSQTKTDKDRLASFKLEQEKVNILFEKYKDQPSETIQAFKNYFNNSIKEIEEKADTGKITDKEFNNYRLAKTGLVSIERLERERQAPTQAPAVAPQSPKATAGVTGTGTAQKPNEQAELSNAEQTNIEGMRRVLMAMYANDPAKLKQALDGLEQGEQGIKKGEIELTAKLETKKQAEFVAPEPSKEQDREQGKKGIDW